MKRSHKSAFTNNIPICMVAQHYIRIYQTNKRIKAGLIKAPKDKYTSRCIVFNLVWTTIEREVNI